MKAKVLLKQRLASENSSGDVYRLVAKPVEFGFNGIEYVLEKRDGFDALGDERWIEDENYTSKTIAAIGQYLLEKEND